MSRFNAVGTSRWLSLFVGVAALWSGAAAAADTYIILSLIGDRITVVREVAQTGSRIEKNQHEVIPLADPAFDDYAVRVADATIAKARPDAGAMTLRADRSLYGLRDGWLGTDTIDAKALLSILAKQIPPSPDKHLLLIVPYRAELDLRTQNDYRGQGKVAGLGFYLDTTTRMRRSDTQESSVGLLGIFAHFQLVLINLQSGAVEAHEPAVIGTTRAAARAEDRDPWNALSPAQKSRLLESLTKEEIERVLPGMLTGPKH